MKVTQPSGSYKKHLLKWRKALIPSRHLSFMLEYALVLIGRVVFPVPASAKKALLSALGCLTARIIAAPAVSSSTFGGGGGWFGARSGVGNGDSSSKHNNSNQLRGSGSDGRGGGIAQPRARPEAQGRSDEDWLEGPFVQQAEVAEARPKEGHNLKRQRTDGDGRGPLNVDFLRGPYI